MMGWPVRHSVTCLEEEATHSGNPQQRQEEVVRPPHAASDEVPVLKKNGGFAGQGEPLQPDQAPNLGRGGRGEKDGD